MLNCDACGKGFDKGVITDKEMLCYECYVLKTETLIKELKSALRLACRYAIPLPEDLSEESINKIVDVRFNTYLELVKRGENCNEQTRI